MLYMFQAVPSPIIRSSKLYIQHQVLCQTFTANCTVVEGLELLFQLFHDSGFDKAPDAVNKVLSS